VDWAEPGIVVGVGRRTQKVTPQLSVGVPDLSLRLKDIARYRQICGGFTTMTFSASVFTPQ